MGICSSRVKRPDISLSLLGLCLFITDHPCELLWENLFMMFSIFVWSRVACYMSLYPGPIDGKYSRPTQTSVIFPSFIFLPCLSTVLFAFSQQALFASCIPEIIDLIGTRPKYGGTYKNERGRRYK